MHPLRWPAVLLALLVGAALLGQPSAARETAPRSERVMLGMSVEGRPLVAWHRWRDGANRSLLVVGNLHGDERAGLRVVRRLRSAPLPPRVDLWLLPSANPDGTAAGGRTNARGVDLNRNFPRFWQRTGARSGPSAASEPETRALLQFVRRVRPHTTVVLHQPLNGVDAYRAKSLSLVRSLAREIGLPVKVFDCQGGCHGTFTDWHNARTPGRAVTVELGERVPATHVARVARALLRVATGP